MKYIARDLLKLTEEELFALPDGKITVVFDDGELETTTRRTIVSTFFQDFHRKYPKTPLLKDRHHIGDSRVGSNLTLKFIGNALWDTYDAYEHKLCLEDLSKLAYEITNRFYNVLSYRLEPWVTSISILDFIDVLDDPDVKKANTEVKPYEKSITAAHSVIESTLRDPKKLKGNAIAEAVKSNLVSTGQVLQCVGPRGTVTDIDSTIFRHPVLVGYAEGLRSLYDSMIESRSAAKALVFTEDPLKETEYFNREMQLLSGSIKNLYGVYPVHNKIFPKGKKPELVRDCGSTDYKEIRLGARDLKAFQGKYYLAADQTLKPITATSSHLIGQTVLLRTTLGCNIPDREGFCATCFGELSYSVPEGTNIGHLCTTSLCEKLSQAVLSTKHLDSSSAVDDLVLDDHASKYLKRGVDPNTIGLASRLKGAKVELLVESDEVKSLSDINHVDDIEGLSIRRISGITNVMLKITKGKQTDQIVLPVSIGSRKSSFNHKMLAYIKQHGAVVCSENANHVLVNLDNWNFDDVIFTLELKHINMVDYMHTIKTFVFARAPRNVTTLKSYSDPWQALMGLYDIVNSKLTVNVAHLEIFILAALIRSNDEGSHMMPVAGEASEFASYSDNMKGRSMSSLLAYQHQTQTIYSTSSYVVRDRPSHPLDEVIRSPE